MKTFRALFLTILLPILACPQGHLPEMLATEAQFLSAAQQEIKSAFLEYLAPDSILFRPQAVSGREYWTGRPDASIETLIRKTIYADIDANGLLGYTTGNWRQFKKGKSESDAAYGQYVTIWEKRPDGKFRASLDIVTTHEMAYFKETDEVGRVDKSTDMNKRGWSPADASMDFLRRSMSSARLGGAYRKYAAKDIRLLVERQVPILGKKRVVVEMNRYVSTDFPANVRLLQSTDMAYTWNPCKFTNNSDEGFESGNCLQIWKLRNKKWWIVLGVYAKFANDRPPVLRTPLQRAGEN